MSGRESDEIDRLIARTCAASGVPVIPVDKGRLRRIFERLVEVPVSDGGDARADRKGAA